MEIGFEAWLCLGLLVGFFGGFYAHRMGNRDYFNSNACSSKNEEKFQPQFEVVKIEQEYDCDMRGVAKYTVLNCFHNKKNNRDFVYQTFYFYDKNGLYNIGDKLTFARCEKNKEYGNDKG